MTLEQEFQNIMKAKREIKERIEEICREATIAAVNKAAELTPAVDDLAGTNMRTGAMKQSWTEASVVDPVWEGNNCVTYLKNGMAYASYVDEGHRLKRHFVPGLVINEFSGKLERVPRDAGGITVGTKTKYVKGLFITDKAVQVYNDVCNEMIDKLWEDLQ